MSSNQRKRDRCAFVNGKQGANSNCIAHSRTKAAAETTATKKNTKTTMGSAGLKRSLSSVDLLELESCSSEFPLSPLENLFPIGHGLKQAKRLCASTAGRPKRSSLFGAWRNCDVNLAALFRPATAALAKGGCDVDSDVTFPKMLDLDPDVRFILPSMSENVIVALKSPPPSSSSKSLFHAATRSSPTIYNSFGGKLKRAQYNEAPSFKDVSAVSRDLALANLSSHVEHPPSSLAASTFY